MARAIGAVFESGLAAGLSARGEVDEGSVVAAGEAMAGAELHVEAGRILRELETYHDLILVPRSMLVALAKATDGTSTACVHGDRLATLVNAALVEALGVNYAEAVIGRPCPFGER